MTIYIGILFAPAFFGFRQDILLSKRKIVLSPDEQEALRSIGNKIAERRETMGINQVTLAEDVGISERTLRSLEAGKCKNPGAITLRRIAVRLKMSPDELSLETTLTIKERKEKDKWPGLTFLWRQIPLKIRNNKADIIEMILKDGIREPR